ncbi:MAG: hypothetical protein DRN35_00755 [Thermoplasmata archaeon]|nr:MAG: hypothetical protein DRN35_00755 [Thermoplasmata archaeon]RLF72722.1 MAG: hypothetical protein DRN55_05700 [Thermoplasmata archaeon]HDD60258.1 DUF89 family protein [Euryarchaeota archaeon]
MKVDPQCVPCLLGRILYEVKLAGGGKDVQKKVIKRALEIMSKGFSEKVASVELATEVHRETYSLLGDDDPYREVKRRSTAVAKELLPLAENYYREAEDRLTAAGTLAVVGNLLDFGIMDAITGPEVLKENFRKYVSEGLHVNHLRRAEKLLLESKDRTVIYFTDNAGEVVFDRFLIEEFKNRGAKVFLVPKGVPILTDATVEDLQEADLLEMVDGIYKTSTFYVGVEIEKMDEKLKKAMEEAALIVYKGMANYEAVSEPEGYRYRPRMFIMKAKCEPVASSLGVKKGENVALLQL